MTRSFLHWHAAPIAVWLAMPYLVATAGELSSTNTDRLQRFWAAAESGRRPVTVVAFGDSLQATYRSLAKEVLPRFASLLGQAGRSFDGQFPGVSVPDIAAGTVYTPPTTNWFLDHFEVPPGGRVSWENKSGLPGGSLRADSVGIHFVAWPNGGDFTLSISTNGGPWAWLATVNGKAAAAHGRFARFELPLGNYRLRIEGVAGTNLILWQELVATSSAGIKTVWLQRDGLNLNTVFDVPTNVLYPVISNLHPDLVIWHMKELADLGAISLSNRLHDLEILWHQGAPNADVIYVGTPYEARDASENITELQNAIVRAAAVRDQRCYLDCMSPMMSYAWMASHGYLDDPVHPSAACYRQMADIFWRELGFDALLTDRTITVSAAPNGLRLECATLTNFTYLLQASTDLLTWSTIQSNRGDGFRQTYSNSFSAPTEFYRIKLKAE